ncbi:MAG: MFS transporter [Verrucomicrobia bacterium]|nr:MAG: MFS transporter [Verrucomicrobiota bacterium]
MGGGRGAKCGPSRGRFSALPGANQDAIGSRPDLPRLPGRAHAPCGPRGIGPGPPGWPAAFVIRAPPGRWAKAAGRWSDRRDGSEPCWSTGWVSDGKAGRDGATLAGVAGEVTQTVRSGQPGGGTQTPPGRRRLLVGAMLLQFAVNGSILPFVTMLLRDRGLSYEQASWLFVAGSCAMLVAPFFWGYLADRFLPLNRVFFVLNLVGAAALWVFDRQPGVTGMLLAWTVFSACLNPIFTLTNSLAFHHLARPQEEFPRLRAWGSLGWILPFLPISLHTAWQPDAGLGFCVHLAMGLALAMAAYSFCLPHTEPGARGRRTGAEQGGRASGGPLTPRLYGPALRRLLGNWDYVVLLGSMFFMSGAFMMVVYYAPPFLEERGVPRPWIGPVQAVGVIFEIVLFQWQAALLRRHALTSIILLGGLALVVRHLVYAATDALWLLVGSYLLVAMVVVFHHTGVSLLANSLAGREVRSTAQTLLAFCGLGLGPLFASAVATLLTSIWTDELRPVFLAGGLRAATAMGLVGWRRKALETAARGRMSVAAGG